MRAAVLADIHGNLPALSAVLGEPDVAGADAVVLLGDIALGPVAAQTLEVLAGLGDRAVWVHGNCEREMVTAFDGGEVPGRGGADAAASAALIGRAHRDRLGGSAPGIPRLPDRDPLGRRPL
jgi:predicted phosphodiesterase